jgi:hypothetical protein
VEPSDVGGTSGAPITRVLPLRAEPLGHPELLPDEALPRGPTNTRYQPDAEMSDALEGATPPVVRETSGVGIVGSPSVTPGRYT